MELPDHTLLFAWRYVSDAHLKILIAENNKDEHIHKTRERVQRLRLEQARQREIARKKD